jgi:hypothetical protein
MLKVGLIAVAILLGVYGVHRLCLALEDRGQLYYLHRKSSSSGAARMFSPFQQMIDPPARQVVEAEDHQVKNVDADDPTEDDGQPKRPWEFPSGRKP